MYLVVYDVWGSEEPIPVGPDVPVVRQHAQYLQELHLYILTLFI